MMPSDSSKFVYEEVSGWAHLPENWRVKEISGVAVDSQDRVYALGRGFNPVAVFDRDGNFLAAWGGDVFKRAHHIIIDRDDNIFCVDDMGHRVLKFAPDGTLLMAIESTNRHATAQELTARGQVVEQPHPPFNYPTGVALARGGDIYVSDGYGNARIHKFTPDGIHLFSWGTFGSEAGQFHLPHGVLVDHEGLVYISDRMNRRVQVFTPDGEFVTQWDDVRWPNNMCLDANGNFYIAELGALFLYDRAHIDLSQPSGRITVRDARGTIISEWGMHDPLGDGRFFAPHDIAVDSVGNVYIGEVAATYSGGKAPVDWPMLRKFVRV